MFLVFFTLQQTHIQALAVTLWIKRFIQFWSHYANISPNDSVLDVSKIGYWNSVGTDRKIFLVPKVQHLSHKGQFTEMRVPCVIERYLHFVVTFTLLLWFLSFITYPLLDLILNRFWSFFWAYAIRFYCINITVLSRFCKCSSSLHHHNPYYTAVRTVNMLIIFLVGGMTD